MKPINRANKKTAKKGKEAPKLMKPINRAKKGKEAPKLMKPINRANKRRVKKHRN